MAWENPVALTAPSTDSEPNHIIYSTTTQFRPLGSQHRGKTPVRSHVSILGPWLPLFAQLQLQHLKREKNAALKDLQKMKYQQTSNTGLLQKTAATIQKPANTATIQTIQLSDALSH